MYGNGVELSMVDTLKRDGLLPHIAYRTGDAGADLFRHACRSCHTWDGYKPLKPAFDGTDPAFIAFIVRHADGLRGNMPPFVGTDSEAQLIAGHIHALSDRRPLEQIHGVTGVELGRRVWDVRCGKCHEAGGRRDVQSTFKGMSAGDLGDLLDAAGELSDAMPAFTGTAVERAALIEFLGTQGGGN